MRVLPNGKVGSATWQGGWLGSNISIGTDIPLDSFQAKKFRPLVKLLIGLSGTHPPIRAIQKETH
jgi:hypothetical protein